MRRGHPYVKLVALITFVIAIAHSVPARADRVDDLAKALSSSNEKARMSAVLSLAKLGDKRTLKPLVTALADPSAEIRALAATALGHLKHKAALPALRNAATDDTDETVKIKARAAAIEVAKANQLPSGLANPDVPQPVQARHTTGFGHSPHAVEDRPDLYVMVKSASDDSPGHEDKVTRKSNADIVKQSLLDSFARASQVTMVASEAKRWSLDPRTIDLSVVKVDVSTVGGMVEIAVDLRLAISDDKGKMLSFLSGGAKVQVPSGKFNSKYLAQFRKQALEGAMQGMFDKLLVHLRQTAQS
jgi:hypothetical protein